VFLTSPSRLVGGVRSGTRRPRAASAPAQAAGGTETETHRTVPAQAGTVLIRAVCGQCRKVVQRQVESDIPVTTCAISRPNDIGIREGLLWRVDLGGSILTSHPIAATCRLQIPDF